MSGGGEGETGGTGRPLLRLAAPGGQPGRRRPVQEQHAADGALHLRLYARPQRVQYARHAADAGAVPVYGVQIVADRLFAGNVAERAEDGAEEAGQRRIRARGRVLRLAVAIELDRAIDRKSTRLNSSH